MTTENKTDLPAIQTRDGMDFGLGKDVAPALQVFLNEKLFDRARVIAGYMAKAEGAMPKHLIGKMEACFAVFTRAIGWKLDPFMVAAATYQTPAGNIGYEGKLCQAILENSGMIEGSPEYVHFHDVKVTAKDNSERIVRSCDAQIIEQARKDGCKVEDCNRWQAIVGNFHMEQSSSGRGKYAVADWQDGEEDGLGVRVIVRVRGEPQPRTFDFLLVQAQPRNSTLWATDPMTQICYLAIRRFCSVRAPGLFMGVPFDREDWDDDIRARNARDVTPRPSTAAARHEPDPEKEPAPSFELVDEAGTAYVTCHAADDWVKELLAATAPVLNGPISAKAMTILLNNADAAQAVMRECQDIALVEKLQMRYAQAEEQRIEEPQADDAGQGEGSAGDRTAAASDFPADAATGSAQAGGDGGRVPAGVTGSSQGDAGQSPPADSGRPAGPRPAAEGGAPDSTPADGSAHPSAPPPAADLKAMEMPMTARNKPDGAKYLALMQQEISMATDPRHVDVLLKREAPNLRAVTQGCRSSIDLFAVRWKNKLQAVQ